MLCGVDEAGRGALAGPVVAAAVILDPLLPPEMFKDSKQLTYERREVLYNLLMESRSYIGVWSHSAWYVDKVNILNATMSAMKRSVLRLVCLPEEVVIDGNRVPDLGVMTVRSVVQGDVLIPEISAASIVAKVTRDRIMEKLDEKFPGYGFSIHKGYGTPDHYDAVFSKGPSQIHRKSFNLTRQERLF
jgi:ribonuclease HII